jgi:hypothetical protein
MVLKNGDRKDSNHKDKDKEPRTPKPDVSKRRPAQVKRHIPLSEEDYEFENDTSPPKNSGRYYREDD